MTPSRTLVLIPARMAATRLPGKPLLDIAGLPMIVHVLRRAEAAKIAPAAKLDTSRTRQVARTAPRILLSSKESIFDQAPGRNFDLRPA